MAEIRSLPIDGAITGTEILVLVDLDDSNLGKIITIDSLATHVEVGLTLPSKTIDNTNVNPSEPQAVKMWWGTEVAYQDLLATNSIDPNTEYNRRMG